LATLQEARKGLEWAGGWLYDRLGLRALTYHVPAYANRLPYLLGGITLIGTLILIATGIYLAQFYHPDPADAHASVFYITTEARLGDFVRSVHYWTAHIVMVTLLLHLLRVLIWGAYRAPREVTWAIGVGLLAVMMGFFFTGTVLKWDQEGFEAYSHNEEIGTLLGSLGVWFTAEFSRSASILQRVYAAHVSILPALLTLLVLGHIFLVRYHGIAPRPGEEKNKIEAGLRAAERGEAAAEVSHFTVHIRKIIAYGLLLTALAGILSLALAAPLGPPAVPGEELTKPAWVFIWLYPFENWWGVESLLWIPLALMFSILLLPLFDRFRANSGRRMWLVTGIAVAVLAALVALGLYGWTTTPAEHLVE
jgi:ubiquinol-cytochrome c reductase cytochrome b subunit